MINKERVQRIRNLIYSLLILLIFVPVILIIVLCFRMVGAIDELSVYLSQAQSMTQTEPVSEQQGGVAPDPENQALSTASKPESRPMATSEDGSVGSERPSSPLSTEFSADERQESEAEPRQQTQDKGNAPDGSNVTAGDINGLQTAVPDHAAGGGTATQNANTGAQADKRPTNPYTGQ